MKFQVLISWNKKKNIMNLLSAEFALREVKVKEYLMIIMEYFSPVLHKNIYCGFTLKALKVFMEKKELPTNTIP